MVFLKGSESNSNNKKNALHGFLKSFKIWIGRKLKRLLMPNIVLLLLLIKSGKYSFQNFSPVTTAFSSAFFCYH